MFCASEPAMPVIVRILMTEEQVWDSVTFSLLPTGVQGPRFLATFSI